MQTMMLYVAQGKKWEDRPCMAEDLLASLPGAPCGSIKVYADGWRSISVVGLVGMMNNALRLKLLTVEVGDSILLKWILNKLVLPLVRCVYVSN